MENAVLLVELAGKLRPLLGEQTPNYRALYLLLCSGVFTMNKWPGSGGYFCMEGDVPAIAKAIEAHRARRNRRPVAA